MAEPKLGFRTTILGNPWTCYFLSKRDYKKKWGDDSVGLTDADEKAIYFLTKRLRFDVVAHELMHAYLEEVCITPASLDAAQTEEVACDVVGKYGRTIVAQADEILLAYKILKTKVDQTD